MVNRFSVNPLGGFNVGNALQGLGQQFREQERYDTQQREQEDLRAFTVQAQSGDPIAMKELFARDPRMAMAIEQRNAEKAATMNSQEVALSKDAEMEWGIAWKQAQTPEEKEALMQQAVINPLIDIKESDIGTDGPMADLAVNTMLYGHMGDKAYNQFFGGQDDIKTEAIQTPTGAIVINKQTGETVKDIAIPEKKAQFEFKKEERAQALRQKRTKEISNIKKAKIAEADAKDARQDTLSTTARAFALTKELGNEDVIAPVTGWWDRSTPTGNESQDIINKALELKDLLTLNNLGLMSGVLTDRDIAILARAGSGLNVDEDGFLGSEEGVVKQIKKVENMLDAKLKQAVKRGDLSQLDYDKIKSDDSESGRTDGKIMIDANGKRAMVYPDGTFKELP